MKSLAIAGANLRRLMRDRVGLFFLFVFPLVIIVTIGAVFGSGFIPKLGLVNLGRRALTRELAADVRGLESIDVDSYDSRQEVLTAVERGNVEAGLVLPANLDESLRGGDVAAVSFVARPDDFEAFSVRTAVNRAVARQSALLRAARFAAAEQGGSLDENLERAREVAGGIPTMGTTFRFSSGGGDDTDVGRFDTGAAQQLILFMFLTSLSASAQLIQTRRLGVSRRMFSTPTSAGAVLWGETLGRFGVAMVQGLFIVVASALLFGVNWGDPLGTALVVVLFALVGSGAAMLFGAIFSNDQQAAAVGTFAGLALAALGGCMVPLEIFPDTMQTVARATPHAWALEALDELIVDNGGVGQILGPLGVLAAFAAVLLALAATRLYRAMVS